MVDSLRALTQQIYLCPPFVIRPHTIMHFLNNFIHITACLEILLNLYALMLYYID